MGIQDIIQKKNSMNMDMEQITDDAYNVLMKQL